MKTVDEDEIRRKAELAAEIAAAAMRKANFSYRGYGAFAAAIFGALVADRRV